MENYKTERLKKDLETKKQLFETKKYLNNKEADLEDRINIEKTFISNCELKIKRNIQEQINIFTIMCEIMKATILISTAIVILVLAKLTKIPFHYIGISWAIINTINGLFLDFLKKSFATMEPTIKNFESKAVEKTVAKIEKSKEIINILTTEKNSIQDLNKINEQLIETLKSQINENQQVIQNIQQVKTKKVVPAPVIKESEFIKVRKLIK